MSKTTEVLDAEITVAEYEVINAARNVLLQSKTGRSYTSPDPLPNLERVLGVLDRAVKARATRG